jgi:hypothetical protein
MSGRAIELIPSHASTTDARIDSPSDSTTNALSSSVTMLVAGVFNWMGR